MSQLLTEIEAFLEKHDIAASTFGDRALGDRHFVRQLRSGRRVWDDTAAKVRSFMQDFIATGDGLSPGKEWKNTDEFAAGGPTSLSEPVATAGAGVPEQPHSNAASAPAPSQRDAA